MKVSRRGRSRSEKRGYIYIYDDDDFIILLKVTTLELWVEAGMTRANLYNTTFDSIGKSID